MTTYIEIHAIQNVPPANLNRDDTGAPKTATYGGAVRGRVSSQSWKRAMRRHFNDQLDPKDVGRRSKQVVKLLMDAVVERDRDLEERAESLAVSALKAAGFDPKPKKGKKGEPDGTAELGYLLFVSQRQIAAVADVIVANADAGDDKALVAAFKAAGVKNLLDADHSIDISLFGRMVADAPDLNVDAACQVAHAIGVHEVVPEFDYFTAVDDVVEAAEEAGAGMIGTVEFYSSTFYRYAAVNLDQLATNLGDEKAVSMAVESFVRAFVESMPSGKQNTFASGTRPTAVLVTVAEGQPASLVGAFEEPVKDSLGYVKPAVGKLADHAREVFDTWRKPKEILVCGLPGDLSRLAELGDVVSFDELAARAGKAGVAS
ncbi:type I-E CRISPR-associated protein Cas7/Cse4/CasC [Enemella evansiae]|uniref:type I-E CRISPR-associated protein Cas7/Cse4/CasC n=1 Tax=Enemella evansiae TaxID=2016499 RepID=UPI000B970A44|nr:type I-E CRISPR-associated protein Cas7/Cse4/CasC [Enemella evansiae]OYO16965.1 type I-E CRISPR-associated protein Cas7/Cse4/CasC [Enemella evansiae]